MKKPIMAIMYDFDKTLSTTDMQNYGFIPALGMTPDEFWGMTGEFSKKSGMERILSYMFMMIKLGKEKGLPMTQKWFNSLGENIKYYPGVEKWFKRINRYGKNKGVKIEHYLISSGTKEIVDGCAIAKEFTKIYGCEFYYDPETKQPLWPKFAINYTQKTQYIFRICKGVKKISDDSSVNQKQENKRIPYENMVYLGDGMTDVPCMVLIKQNGGNPIAVYSKKDKENAASLIKGGRVNYVCKADYNEGSDLDETIKLIIDKISLNYQIAKKEAQLKDKELRGERRVLK